MPHDGEARVREIAPRSAAAGAGSGPARRDAGADSSGVLLALGAYGIWGGAPIYWKALSELPAAELLAHRVLWSLAVGALLLCAPWGWREFAAVLRPRRVAPIALSALLLAANWLTFLWAVNHDQVLATSLGYYINPLVSVVLGMLFLGERLRPLQLAALALATIGVARMALDLGELPWVALVLAGSFGLYGLVRKQAPVTPRVGFALETLLLAPLAALYLARLAAQGHVSFPLETAAANGLLALSGAFTAAPLLLFNAAAKRLRLATVGFFQYVAPSLTFVLAVAVFDEPFTRSQAFAFGCVWGALLVYSLDSLRALRGA